MGSAEELGCRSRKFAQRFLRTAVVVDDKAYMSSVGDVGPNSELEVPDRSTKVASEEDQIPITPKRDQSLNAGQLMESFSALGVICGVVGPMQSDMDVLRQADIVVLDWRLQEDDPQYTLRLLYELLTGEADQRNSLRLVAIYTGEARLEDIRAEIVARLKEARLDPCENENRMVISYRHGRVVIYAKSAVNLAEPLKDRSVSEEDLPDVLIDDFSDMTEGLLPSVALTSLTAVREGEHKVLDQFSADLDPAFLAHRVCLSDPEDAERQIVNHVAEELRGLMDNTVAEESPAGADAVEGWIRRKGENMPTFQFDQREVTVNDTVKLAKKGLEKAGVLPKNAFEGLSAGFAGQIGDNLDKELAWIMSFRTVFNAPPPTLWLGSIVTAVMDGDEQHLICMRPRCDCVRLKKRTSFLFLPLVEPTKHKEQLVIKLDQEYKRMGIELDSSDWVLIQFNPSESSSPSPVTATKRQSDGGFEFTDTCNRLYTWRGELTAENAQRIAQNFATKQSRVAVDESEWLRRLATKG
ncbi:MAG: response regulator receiver domain [Gemmatimonadota bacterium]|nr:response regulator receiver domain [Gemmatimonadota bacterium]